MAVNYVVRDLIVPVRQPSSMACWAAMYTMMHSWRNQVSIPIERAVEHLGPRYADCYARNTGLPIEENRNLATAAGMRAEALQNFSAEGWERLLRNYGLLWTSYGWQQFDATGLVETRAGRHIIIIYGIVGDGSGNGTTVMYVDPADGRFHTMKFGQFVGQHETGFTMRPLSNTQLGQFSQVMHY